MNRDQALDKFRELHESARRGRVSLEYRALTESFLRSVADAQNSALAPHQKRRATPRVQRALQVDLTWATGRIRTTTFDVGLGGFSALLSTSPGAGCSVQFTIRLPRGQVASGTARVVGSRSRNRAVRISFVLHEVADRRPLETWIVDELLSEFCPDTRKPVGTDGCFVELTGRALVAARSTVADAVADDSRQ